MSSLAGFLAAPHTVLYLANVALAVVLTSAIALLANLAWRRSSAPARHGLLWLALLGVLASPALVWLADRVGVGWLQVTLGEARDPLAGRRVVPVTDGPVVDAKRSPQLLESTGTRWRLDFGPEHPASGLDAGGELPVNLRPSPDRSGDEVASPPRPARGGTGPWWPSLGQKLALIWAAGTILSLLWLLCGFVRLAGFRRGLHAVGWDSVPIELDQDFEQLPAGSGRSPNPRGVRQAAARAAVQVGLARKPRLFTSAQTPTPVTFGLFRPAVVLPESLADDLPPDQLDAVLVHELAHVVRRDPWVGLLQRLAAAFYWWCPLVHRLNRRLADVREELCDNYVLCRQDDGASLAAVLVTLAERLASPAPLPATVSMWEQRRARERSQALEQRIRRLLSPETSPMTRMHRVGLLLVVLAGVGMTVAISLSHVRAAGEDIPAAESGAADFLVPLPAIGAGASQNGHEAAALNGPLASATGEDPFLQPMPFRSPRVHTGATPQQGADPFASPAMKPDSPSAGQVLPPPQAQPAAGDDATQAPDPASGATADESAAITALERLNARITHDDQAVGRPVIAVRLGGDRVQDATLQCLQAFPRLTSLTLIQTEVTDAGLVHLGGLPRLEILSLQHTHITDAGVPHLLEVTSLRELDLRGTWVTDDGVERLAGLTKLQSLDLTGIPVAEATVEQFKRTSPKPVLAGAEIVWDAVPQLQGDEAASADADLIAEIKRLRGKVELDVQRPGKPLVGAWLQGRLVDDRLCERLKGASHLETLHLWFTRITDAGLQDLGSLTRLRRLSIADTPITDAGLAHLQELDRLERLHLPRTEVTGAGLADLQGLKQLDWLDLRGTPITDGALEHVRDWTQLRKLWLDETNLTGAGLAHLRGLSQLERVYLRGTEVRAEDVRDLKRALPRVRIHPATLAWGWQTSGRGEQVEFTAAQKRIITILEEDTRIEFIETPLRDVAAFLRDQHDIPLRIDEESLRAASLGPELPVTQKLTRMSLHTGLRLLLRRFDLTYVVGDEALIITTLAGTRQWLRQGAIGADEVQRELAGNGVFEGGRRAIFNAFKKPIDIRFAAVPLAQAVADVEDKHNIPVALDLQGLAAVGVRPDVSCTMNEKDVTLESGLRRLLGDLGLTYVVDDEVLLITAPKKGEPAEDAKDEG